LFFHIYTSVASAIHPPSIRHPSATR